MPETKEYHEAILFDKDAALQVQIFSVVQFLNQIKTVMAEMPKELQKQVDPTKLEAARQELTTIVRYGLDRGQLIGGVVEFFPRNGTKTARSVDP